MGNADCSGNISLIAFLNGVEIGGESGTLPFSAGLDGTTGKGLPIVNWSAGISTTSENLTAGESNVSLAPAFSYIASGLSASLFSNVTMALDFTVNYLGAGQSISLPDSLWLSVGDAQASQVPEPGTVLLLGAGLAGFYWFRKR